MSAATTWADVAAWLAPALRVVVAVAVLPIFGRGTAATWSRLAVGLALAVAVVPSAVGSAQLPAMTGTTLAFLFGREALLGWAMGMAASIALSVGQLAGGVLDGLSPGWRVASRPLGHSSGPAAAYLLLGTVTLFFTLGGHLHLVGSLIASFRAVPVGLDSAAVGLVAERVVANAGSLFAAAASAVLPAVVLVALAEVLLGIVARIGGWSGLPNGTLRGMTALVAVLATLYGALVALSGWMLSMLGPASG